MLLDTEDDEPLELLELALLVDDDDVADALLLLLLALDEDIEDALLPALEDEAEVPVAVELPPGASTSAVQPASASARIAKQTVDGDMRPA